MKQGKLIRRAVSAALAGCMMFTLSAPALAESTDALMQLSTGFLPQLKSAQRGEQFSDDHQSQWKAGH